MSEHPTDPDADAVVVRGPWPGSSPARQPARHAPQKPRYVPRRVRTDRYGNRVLMYCKKCFTPWAPYVDIPADKLCATCRPLAAADPPDTPALISRDELT